MQEPSIHNILNKSFSKSDKEQWHRIASQELTGKNLIENLTWKIDDLNFNPYYDQEDLKNLDYLKNYHIPPYRLPYSEAGNWQNLPRITVSDEKEGNALALQYLASGADGVLFDVSRRMDVNIDRLLEKINWPYCNVSLITSDNETIASKILKHVDQQNYDPSMLSGSIFCNQLPENKKTFVRQLSSLKKFHSLGIIIPSSSPVQEISKSLEQGVLFMDGLTNLGIDKELVFRNISMSIFCDPNFYITIAKFRALRLLWYQLSQAFEIVDYRPYDLHIHACSEKRVSEKWGPNENMIKSVPDAIASVLGGCDAVTLCVEDESNAMMNRVSLFVSNILKEESHLDKVADAVAGAYAIENIVHELAQAAWRDFQNKVST